MMLKKALHAGKKKRRKSHILQPKGFCIGWQFFKMSTLSFLAKWDIEARGTLTLSKYVKLTQILLNQ